MKAWMKGEVIDLLPLYPCAGIVESTPSTCFISARPGDRSETH